MDLNKLLKALDDESNETLLNFTTNEIKDLNLKILKELHLSNNETRQLLEKLKDYKYVDEMDELKYGSYIKWIPIDDPKKIYLTKGSLFCEIKITNNGTFCICKNFGFKSGYFQISLDKNIIFQKLTDQERVLLSALDHLSK